MPRVKGSVQTRARRKKILKLAKGYFGSKRTLFRTAHEQVMRSLAYAYRDRKQTKRNFRKIWISRINAACKQNNFKYSLLINGLLKAGVVINRKMLADLAVNDPKGFANIVEVAKKGLAGEVKPVVAEVAVKAPKAEVKVAPKAEVKVAPKAEVKEAPKAVEVDLEKLTVAQLKEMAQELGLSGLSGMKKADLVEAIRAAQTK
jgi:large subunit ribosomal protein L20